MHPVITVTDDGSHSLFNPELNECYHSKFGAITESEHIFIKCGLLKVSETRSQINILEIGFGTGLNALLTLRATMHSKKIHFTAVELYPIDKQIVKSLNYCDSWDLESYTDYFLTMHQSAWEMDFKVTDNFTLNKIEIDLCNYQPPVNSFDLIYFDAFSPNVQPELWTTAIFQKLYNSLNENGILVTYCAKGIVKQALRDAGFIVKRLTGPPGKRHIISAEKVKM